MRDDDPLTTLGVVSFLNSRPLIEGLDAACGVSLHYAVPSALPSMLRRGEVDAALIPVIDALSEMVVKIGVMLPHGWDASDAAFVYRWGPWDDGETLARRLFAGLRELDEAGASVIVCPVPEMGGIGEAIRDRLRKAAQVK